MAFPRPKSSSKYKLLYIYIYTHTYIYIYIYIYTHTHTFTHIYNLVHRFHVYCTYNLLHRLQYCNNPVNIVITSHQSLEFRISCLFLDHIQRGPRRTPVLLNFTLLLITQVEKDHVLCDLLLWGSYRSRHLLPLYGKAPHLNRSLHKTSGTWGKFF